MFLIDIMKLNDEVDKMIARQKSEIDDMNMIVEDKHEEIYNQFVSDINEMIKISHQIGKRISVETDAVYCNYKLSITFVTDCESCLIEFREGRCIGGRIWPCNSYDKVKHYADTTVTERIMRLAYWWNDPCNREVFRRRFEEECVKAIKDKAESANKIYMKVREKYEDEIYNL